MVSVRPSVRLPDWVVRVGGGLRLRAAPREAFEVERLGRLDDLDLALAFQRPVPELAASDVARATNPGDCRALAALASHLGAARMLEIGTHVGASTAALASVGSVVTVDVIDVNASDGPWSAIGAGESPADMLRRIGLAHRVQFVRAPSLEYFASAPEPFDLIFLDGDHAAATVYRELAAASRAIRPGGVIVLHDYFPEGKSVVQGEPAIPGPFRAVARACSEVPSLDVRPIGTLPWPTKLGSHATTLAMVGRR